MYINKVCAGVTNIDVYKNECRYFLVKRFTLKLNYPHFQNNYLQRKALILIAIDQIKVHELFNSPSYYDFKTLMKIFSFIKGEVLIFIPIHRTKLRQQSSYLDQ